METMRFVIWPMNKHDAIYYNVLRPYPFWNVHSF